MILTALASAATAVPLEPDADEGRRLLADELAKSVYQDARPTLFDLVAQAIGDWIASFLDGAGTAGGGVGLAFILALIAALLVTAFLVFGRPRLERRRRRSTALFGDDDTRTAERMRLDARALAAAGDLDGASLEMFRALARSLDERTLVDLHPGTTATGFARSASRTFADRGDDLAWAARLFDTVRYLGGHADRADYDRLAGLDEALTRARPTASVPAP